MFPAGTNCPILGNPWALGWSISPEGYEGCFCSLCEDFKAAVRRAGSKYLPGVMAIRSILWGGCLCKAPICPHGVSSHPASVLPDELPSGHAWYSLHWAFLVYFPYSECIMFSGPLSCMCHKYQWDQEHLSPSWIPAWALKKKNYSAAQPFSGLWFNGLLCCKATGILCLLLFDTLFSLLPPQTGLLDQLDQAH